MRRRFPRGPRVVRASPWRSWPSRFRRAPRFRRSRRSIARAAGSFSTPVAELQYIDVGVGAGAEAHPGMFVVVSYTGWLYDPFAPSYRGAKFDSSLDRNAAFGFFLDTGKVDPRLGRGRARDEDRRQAHARRAARIGVRGERLLGHTAECDVAVRHRAPRCQADPKRRGEVTRAAHRARGRGGSIPPR